MITPVIKSAALLLQSVYPGLTGEQLKAALDGKSSDNDDVTIREAMQMLKRTRRSIYNYIEAGRLESYKQNNYVMIKRESIEKLMQPDEVD